MFVIFRHDSFGKPEKIRDGVQYGSWKTLWVWGIEDAFLFVFQETAGGNSTVNILVTNVFVVVVETITSAR